jgi:signal transduction histidine kinase/ligand-binding sensor domain-containing protein
MKDGLPATFVYSITQSTDGYIWLGTADGLARFDGIHFVHWHPKRNDKILLGAVRVVVAARDGGVWAGTASGIVVRVRGDDLTTAFAGAPVEAMLEARDGNLWVATANRIVRFRPTPLAQVDPVIPLSADFLSGLLQDKDGFVWFSTRKDVEKIEPRSGKLQAMDSAHGNLWLSRDSGGAIWMTRSDGRTEPQQSTQPVGRTGPRSAEFNIRAVFRDREGTTWINTLGQGLLRTQTAGDDVHIERFSQADGLSNDQIWSSFEDREHNLWVGTQEGLNCFRDVNVTMLKRNPGLANANALVTGADGSIWTSTSAGIYRVDGSHRDLYLPNARAKSLWMDRQNSLWAGTDRGVVNLTKGTSSKSRLAPGLQLNNVVAMADDEQRRMWLFDEEKGLYRWSNGEVSSFFAEPLLKNKSIVAMRGDENGRVWFGVYEGGVVVFEGTRFRAYSERDGLAGGSINGISVDEKGTVWIAAEGGLSRFDGARFVTWGTTQGLPGTRALWVLPDRDGSRLWLGYTTGIALVSRTEFDRSLRNPSHLIAYQFFDSGDGLKGNPDRGWQPPAIQTSDGKIWFRTSAGIASIDPRRLVRNPLAPFVHIEEIIADDVPVDTTKAVHLRPLTRRVEFDYTALSFVEPRRVRFRYKLLGYDSKWHEAGMRREAFYTNLGPQTYRFQVIACNNDGVWNEAGSALEFQLLPAFYQTRWFRLACFVVLMVIGWGLYRLRVWQLTMQLRARFEERLSERTRIAQELHDSLLQNVLGISLQLEVTDEMLSPGLPAKHPLKKALLLSKSAMDDGRRALNDLRTLSLSADDLVKELSQTADGLQTGGGGEISILVEGRARPLNAVAGNDVVQIGRQAIANAFQHARAREIYVLLSYGQRELRISVQDNGRGIDEDTLAHGRSGHYGMRGMRERAERLHASLTIRSRVGQGTEVELCVPANLAYQAASGYSTENSSNRWKPPLRATVWRMLRMRRKN